MTKPFNLADAKAGHPVCTSFGQRAIILKFDCNAGNLPLLGVVSDADVVARWTADGRHADATVGFVFEYNLVMAPIGTIDGKPVYPGDMITVYDTPCQAWHTEPIDWASAKWPRQYPETQMGGEMLRSIYMMTDAEGDHEDHLAVANAAIRHGIDNGYLLDPREQQTISIKLPEMSQEEIKRITSGDTGRASILYDQGPVAYGNLQKLAKALGIHRTDSFEDVKDKIKQRERAIMRKGLELGMPLSLAGWTQGTVGGFPACAIDEYIARVK